MLAPLYSIANMPATVTVAAPGAAQSALSVPVAALELALPNGYVLDFGGAKFARLSADADVDAVALAVDALPTALIAGDEATVPGSPASSLLSEKWENLGGPNASSDERAAAQTALHVDAELLLGLQPAAAPYTGDDADMLGFAVVRQINFMLEHGITPSVVQSSADTNRGLTTTYRNRWVDPDAAAIVARVTGLRQVRFEPAMAGV